jgi:hypothetical protein
VPRKFEIEFRIYSLELQQKMSDFPLYDRLIRDIPSKNLTIKQHQEFLEKVPDINTHGRELLYVLIRCYNKDNGGDAGGTPYGGEVKRCGRNNVSVTWDLASFPHDLRQILYKFVVMHTEEMQEEMMRSETLP